MLNKETLDYCTANMMLAIVERGSFSSAAEALGITQPAVSQKVRKVEQELGKPLFQRGMRSMILTKDGETLYRYAKTMVHLVDDALRHFSGTPHDGNVRIGLVDEVARQATGVITSLFASDFKSLTVELYTGTNMSILELFASGRLDVMVGKQLSGSLRGDVLWQEQPRWLVARTVEVDHAKPFPLIVRTAPCAMRCLALESLREAGIMARVSFEANEPGFIESALRAGLGVLAADPNGLSRDLSGIRELTHLPALPAISCYMDYSPHPAAKSYMPRLTQAVRDALLNRGVVACHTARRYRDELNEVGASV